METSLVCPECAREHGDPAHATLGHRVVCLDCATGRDSEIVRSTLDLVEHQEAA